ncbi:MAG: Uma2 family endonuclease, partial [Chloroflexi bacterium]|nr:Uma2 family endonuclease [Chloroflexota bacterium]
TAMPVTEATYEQLALEDPEGQWELVCGRPRRKPSMTQEHNTVARQLTATLIRQLPEGDYQVALNAGRVRAGEQYFIPDVMVIPTALLKPWGEGRAVLEAYAEPLPLVVEVWSASTGDYDVEAKIPEYLRRGDLEVWRIHPYDRVLTAWRRQPDGTYAERTYTGGDVPVESLPGVVVRLESLYR